MTSRDSGTRLSAPRIGSRWLGLFAVAAASIVGPAFGEYSMKTCDTLAFERVRDEMVAPLMYALSQGNVAEVARHLNRDMSARYETLLTENATYPDYLRSYYANSHHQLRDVVASNGGYTAIIEVFWIDGARDVFELVLDIDKLRLPPIGADSSCP